MTTENFTALSIHEDDASRPTTCDPCCVTDSSLESGLDYYLLKHVVKVVPVKVSPV